MTKTNGICYIAGAMPLEPELIPHPQKGDLVIAADGGYAALAQAGVPIHLVVGDFDSLGTAPDHPNVIRLPRVKDDTDIGYAIKHALAQGFRRFVLLGGLGGRLDHTVANLQLLSFLDQQGAQGILAGGGQAAAVITNGSIAFPAEMSGFCSVFCLGTDARGITLKGLKYELENAQLSSTFPLGVSNEFLGKPARISVRDGALLVIWETNGLIPESLSAVFRI